MAYRREQSGLKLAVYLYIHLINYKMHYIMYIIFFCLFLIQITLGRMG